MTVSCRLCLYVSPIIIYLIFRFTQPALLQAALSVDKTSFTNAQIKPDSSFYSNVLSQTKIGPSISRRLQVKKTRNHLSDVETVHRPQNDKLSIASSARRLSMLFRILTIESTIRIYCFQQVQQFNCCGLYGYRTTTSSLFGSVIWRVASGPVCAQCVRFEHQPCHQLFISKFHLEVRSLKLLLGF